MNNSGPPTLQAPHDENILGLSLEANPDHWKQTLITGSNPDHWKQTLITGELERP